MLLQTRPKVRQATAKDLQKLANLIHFETYVHRHLDYRPPLDWFGNDPFLVMEQNNAITGVLACPPDPPQVAWIRLFAASSHASLQLAWRNLWEEALTELLHYHPARWAAAIPMQNWFNELLASGGFEQTHSIVMLSWESDRLSALPTTPAVNIRPMTLDDLAHVQKIDEAAFPPIWQNSHAYLELAFRQATIAAVAEIDGNLAGYQISTATPLGGHLARLAVEPKYQGRGVGHSLLNDLLTQFVRRGARTVTVNTQKDNHASLALYQRAGFELTGEEYPVYQFDLNR